MKCLVEWAEKCGRVLRRISHLAQGQRYASLCSSRGLRHLCPNIVTSRCGSSALSARCYPVVLFRGRLQVRFTPPEHYLPTLHNSSQLFCLVCPVLVRGQAQVRFTLPEHYSSPLPATPCTSSHLAPFTAPYYSSQLFGCYSTTLLCITLSFVATTPHFYI